MEPPQPKKNPVLVEKPKILYTLGSMNKDPSLTLLNEYRARGSESLRPINRRMTEPKKKPVFRQEYSERKNKMTAHTANEKKDKTEVIQDKKRMKFQVPAHSLSPYKPSRNLPKQLEKIDELAVGNQNANGNGHTMMNTPNNQQKMELLLKGTKSKFTKANTLEAKALNIVKEKTKENGNDCYKYSVGAGNNGRLVKKIMQQKGEAWEEVPTTAVAFNFKWLQNNKTYNYEKLTNNNGVKQLVNHFEFHKEISSKAGLIKNLSFYCEQNKMNMFEMTPITFILDLNKDDCEQTLQTFINFYHRNMPSEMQKPDNQRKLYLDIPKRMKYFYNNYEKKTSLFGMYGKPKMLRTYINGNNYLWLLKPNYFNRGRGIQIFQTLEELEKMIVELCEGVEENVFFHLEKEEKENEKNGEKNVEKNNEKEKMNEKAANNNEKNKKSTIKLNNFIIQKYIERPLLIEGRKFDIRVWVLLTQSYDVFFFKEGYLRTSSEPFILDHNSITNHYIHLTNNAIQKNGKNYGCFEDGNQLSFNTFEKYLNDNKINLDVRNTVIPKIKENILISMNSAKRRFNQDDRKYCFEIFGYDFIIDEDFHVWLIEVNTNPCIEESSPLLHMLIPRMLNDAFKLTLDSMFPMNGKIKQKTQTVNSSNNIAPVNPVSVVTVQSKETIENANEINKPQTTVETQEETKMDVKENLPSELKIEKEEENEIPTKEEDYTFKVNGYSDEENLWELLGNIKLTKSMNRINEKKS